MNWATAAGGQRADELAHYLAVAQRLHGRDALDLVAERELLVGVDVKLDERELARPRLGLALEHGAEHAAGAAPGGPEVDHDRQLVGALDHLALEAFGCHVHWIGFHSLFSVAAACRPRVSMCSSLLSEALSASQQNISKHLAVLADVGILGRRFGGQSRLLPRRRPGIFPLCEEVCSSVQQQLRSLNELVTRVGSTV